MIPIDFEGSNVIFGKPKQMTDEQCMSINVRKEATEDGQILFTEAWLPNKEDIEAIVAGRPIFIQIFHNVLPPISVWTNDENNQPNI